MIQPWIINYCQWHCLVALLLSGLLASAPVASEPLKPYDISAYGQMLPMRVELLIQRIKRQYRGRYALITNDDLYADNLLAIPPPEVTEPAISVYGKGAGFALQLKGVNKALCKTLTAPHSPLVRAGYLITIRFIGSGEIIPNCISNPAIEWMTRSIPGINQITIEPLPFEPNASGPPRQMLRYCGHFKRFGEILAVCKQDRSNPTCTTALDGRRKAIKRVQLLGKAGRLASVLPNDKVLLLESLAMAPLDDDSYMLKESLEMARKLYKYNPGYLMNKEFKELYYKDLKAAAAVLKPAGWEWPFTGVEKRKAIIEEVSHAILDELGMDPVPIILETSHGGFSGGALYNWKTNQIVVYNLGSWIGDSVLLSKSAFETIIEETVHASQWALIKRQYECKLERDKAKDLQTTIFFLNYILYDKGRFGTSELSAEYKRQPVEFFAKQAAKYMYKQIANQ